jgi:hypothetical protein
MNSEVTTANAHNTMASGARGRAVTRVLLDHAVTLQLWQLGKPTMEFKLERSFDHTAVDGATCSIDPEELGVEAVEVAGLFGAVLREVGVTRTGGLTLVFEDGRRIHAAPDDAFESWSYVSEDGGRVISMPGGELSTWESVA